MKLLNGSELAGYIKERQAHEVRALRQAHQIFPKLAIVQCQDDPVINTYVGLKQQYGEDILVAVDVHKLPQDQAPQLINQLNQDQSVHGIIVQLPLPDTAATDEILQLVNPSKDVDGLGSEPQFDPATPMAIMWLLAGYNINLTGKKVVLIGRGKLVGAPLEKLLTESGIAVVVATSKTENLKDLTLSADIIVSATGKPGILTTDMISANTVVVDAGTASEGGRTFGDVDPTVYERNDLTITPAKGGVGPLTVCALFENVIRAARKVAESATASA